MCSFPFIFLASTLSTFLIIFRSLSISIPFMNFSTFISNVGGILGMCLGLSVISLFEIFEKLLLGFQVSQKSEEAMRQSKELEEENNSMNQSEQ